MSKRNLTLAERAVHEMLSSWGVACNPAEWMEAVGTVERALAAERRRIRKALRASSLGIIDLDDALSCVRAPRARRGGGGR